MPIEEALELASERALDLVEVSPLASPPVCKLMDYSNYLYKQKRAERKQKKSQKKTEVKGVRLSIRTGKHDLEVKAKQAKRFLEAKNIVKINLILKGRELTHSDLGFEKMKEFASMIEDIGIIDQEAKLQGYQITMIIVPIKK